MWGKFDGGGAGWYWGISLNNSKESITNEILLKGLLVNFLTCKETDLSLHRAIKGWSGRITGLPCKHLSYKGLKLATFKLYTDYSVPTFEHIVRYFKQNVRYFEQLVSNIEQNIRYFKQNIRYF